MPCRLKEKKKKEIFFSGKIGGGGGRGEREKIKRAALAPGTARCHVIYQGVRRNDRIVPREESICPRFPRRFRVINRHASLFAAFTRQLSTCKPSDRSVKLELLEQSIFQSLDESLEIVERIG